MDPEAVSMPRRSWPRLRRRGPFLQQLVGALLLLVLFAAAARLPSGLARQAVERVRQTVPVDRLELGRLRNALEQAIQQVEGPGGPGGPGAGAAESRPVEGGAGAAAGSGAAPASGGSGAGLPPSFLAMVAPGGEQAELVGAYGWRRMGDVVHFVPGVDWRLPEGAPVRAAAAGEVLQVERNGPLGGTVRVASSGGWTILYGRLASIRVRAGQQVRQGDVIAAAGKPSGERGANLYLQVERNAQPVDPLVLLRVSGRG